MKKSLFLCLCCLYGQLSVAQDIIDDLDRLRIAVITSLNEKQKQVDSLNKRISTLEYTIDSLMSKYSKDKSTIIPSTAAIKLLGLHAASVIAASREVHAFTVESTSTTEQSNEWSNLVNFKIVRQVIPVSEPTALQIRRFFLAPKSLTLEGFPSKCAFLPYLSFRFVGVTDTVDLLICFSCNEYQLWLNGKSGLGGSIKPGRSAVLLIGKKLFREDMLLNNLKN